MRNLQNKPRRAPRTRRKTIVFEAPCEIQDSLFDIQYSNALTPALSHEERGYSRDSAVAHQPFTSLIER